MSKTLQVFEKKVSFLKTAENGKIERFDTQVNELERFNVSYGALVLILLVAKHKVGGQDNEKESKTH